MRTSSKNMHLLVFTLLNANHLFVAFVLSFPFLSDRRGARKRRVFSRETVDDSLSLLDVIHLLDRNSKNAGPLSAENEDDALDPLPPPSSSSCLCNRQSVSRYVCEQTAAVTVPVFLAGRHFGEDYSRIRLFEYQDYSDVKFLQFKVHGPSTAANWSVFVTLDGKCSPHSPVDFHL